MNSKRSYATFGTKILVFRAIIQGAFWVQNGKNDGFTKMSVESWKSYIVNSSSVILYKENCLLSDTMTKPQQMSKSNNSPISKKCQDADIFWNWFRAMCLQVVVLKQLWIRFFPRKEHMPSLVLISWRRRWFYDYDIFSFGAYLFCTKFEKEAAHIAVSDTSRSFRKSRRVKPFF